MTSARYPTMISLNQEDHDRMKEVQKKHPEKGIIDIFRDGLKANEK